MLVGAHLPNFLDVYLILTCILSHSKCLARPNGLWLVSILLPRFRRDCVGFEPGRRYGLERHSTTLAQPVFQGSDGSACAAILLFGDDAKDCRGRISNRIHRATSDSRMGIFDFPSRRSDCAERGCWLKFGLEIQARQFSCLSNPRACCEYSRKFNFGACSSRGTHIKLHQEAKGSD